MRLLPSTMPPLEVARDRLVQFLTSPIIEAPLRPWHPSDLTQEQQLARSRQEAALRAGKLRGLPSVFGELT